MISELIVWRSEPHSVTVPLLRRSQWWVCLFDCPTVTFCYPKFNGSPCNWSDWCVVRLAVGLRVNELLGYWLVSAYEKYRTQHQSLSAVKEMLRGENFARIAERLVM